MQHQVAVARILLAQRLQACDQRSVVLRHCLVGGPDPPADKRRRARAGGSVCDELLIVHRGMVERFALGIDDYPGWINEQQRVATDSPDVDSVSTDKVKSRKQQRQQQAHRRQLLKPLYDAACSIEKKLTDCRDKLPDYDRRLADESLYSSADRKDELRQLVQDQAATRQAISKLEDDWLEASDALESADRSGLMASQ